jgi:tetratricopeptide (TPR) repeat protein
MTLMKALILVWLAAGIATRVQGEEPAAGSPVAPAAEEVQAAPTEEAPTIAAAPEPVAPTEVAPEAAPAAEEVQAGPAEEDQTVTAAPEPVAPTEVAPEAAAAAEEVQAAPTEEAPTIAAAPEPVAPAEETPALAATPAPAAPEPAPPAAGVADETPAVRTADYDELIRENLELRKNIEAAGETEAAVRQQSERLGFQIKDYEERILEMAQLVERLKTEQTVSGPDGDRVKELESQLMAAEAERTRLKQQIAATVATSSVPTAAADTTAKAPTASVQAGSDLFEEVQRQNVELRKRLARAEEEQRRKAVQAQEAAQKEEAARRKGLARELARAKTGERQSREVVDRLWERLPDMEKKLTALEAGAAEKDAALAEKQRDLETYRLELERREDQLRKAEMMAEVLARTRDEVKQASEREKRDLFFNQAVVYAKEGKYREAEQGYLNALRIDPTDADSHYNLGILYDEQFHDRRRAAVRYRRYLTLRPTAPDADIVRNWLRDIEMDKQ